MQPFGKDPGDGFAFEPAEPSNSNGRSPRPHPSSSTVQMKKLREAPTLSGCKAPSWGRVGRSPTCCRLVGRKGIVQQKLAELVPRPLFEDAIMVGVEGVWHPGQRPAEHSGVGTRLTSSIAATHSHLDQPTGLHPFAPETLPRSVSETVLSYPSSEPR